MTESEETSLPLSVNRPLSNGQTGCTGNNDIANWHVIGYIRAVNAWEQIAQAFMRPSSQPLVGMFQPGGFPPSHSNANLINGYNGADAMPPRALSRMKSRIPDRFILQNDALPAPGTGPIRHNYSDSST
jgi:hypothetical protein